MDACAAAWVRLLLGMAMAKDNTAKVPSGRHPTHGSPVSPRGMYPGRPGFDQVFHPELDKAIQDKRDEFDHPEKFRKYRIDRF